MDRDDRILAYVQCKLSDTDVAAFEQDLQRDADMAAEVLALRAARAEFGRDTEQGDATAGWARLEAAINAEHGAPANDNRPVRLSLWQTAGLIAASLALWQVAVVPMTRTQVTPGFEAVSETTQAPVLQVRFSDAAPLGQINALLREVDATVVDGPGALGLYRIAFTGAQQLEAARAALTARPELVEMVTVQ